MILSSEEPVSVLGGRSTHAHRRYLLVTDSFKRTGLLSVPDAVMESSIARCAWLVSSYDGDFIADFKAPSCLAISAARALAIPVRGRGHGATDETHVGTDSHAEGPDAPAS